MTTNRFDDIDNYAGISFSGNTKFSKAIIEANQYLALALESDGPKMVQMLNTAEILTKQAESAAYEHSVGEKIVAANLRNTIETVKAVLIFG